ncbi:MAG: putative metallopeptidase [Desulfitobacterium sp.]
MEENLLCVKCDKPCDREDPCEALRKLTDLYYHLRTEEKIQIIRDLRKELDIVDYEVDPDLAKLGEDVINKRPELNFIREFNIRIGYVRSYESKRDKGKTTFADCRKITGTYTAYLPFDFIITFYDPNISVFTDNQIKILMLHELNHIGIGQRGLKIENHDIEDFSTILQKYGLDWSQMNQDVPDILAGGDSEKGTTSQATRKSKAKGKTK